MIKPRRRNEMILEKTEVNIAYCKLPPWHLWNQVVGHINKTHYPATKKYYHWQDQCRSWLGHSLLIYLLDSVNHELIPANIKTTEFGKPYIDHCVDFNVSHSGDFVIAAITNLGLIGIDIEQVKAINFEDVKYTLTEDQYSQVCSDPVPPTMFYKIWTMKESVVKLMGGGIGIPLQHISSDFITADYDDKKFFLTELKIANDYACCIATDHPVSKFRLVEKDIESFKIK